MTSDSPLEQAKRKFAIQDVFLCDANVWSSRKLALGSEIREPHVQFKMADENECNVTEVDGPNSTRIFAVQYFVGTSVRLLQGGVPEKEPSEDQLVATVSATFVVRYMSDTQPNQDMIQAFNDHAVHHVWPYWREYVESTTARLRVPTVVIPLRHAQMAPIPPTAGDSKQAE
jgi:hypothetical protein